jgi:hypothetical protein
LALQSLRGRVATALLFLGAPGPAGVNDAGRCRAPPWPCFAPAAAADCEHLNSTLSLQCSGSWAGTGLPGLPAPWRPYTRMNDAPDPPAAGAASAAQAAKNSSLPPPCKDSRKLSCRSRQTNGPGTTGAPAAPSCWGPSMPKTGTVCSFAAASLVAHRISNDMAAGAPGVLGGGAGAGGILTEIHE